MTDKVISMADFRKTEEQLDTGELDRQDIQLDYNELMAAAYTLSSLAETGEVVMSDLVTTYEVVADIVLQALEEDEDQLELELEDD